MSIPNHPLKTDNQRLVVLYLVVLSVYGGLFEFCVIVGSRLARALGCFNFVRFLLLYSATLNLSLSLVSAAMWLELFQVKVSFNWQALMLVAECFLVLSALVKFVR
ncbi:MULTISPECIES: hypothetical protein [Vibrio]|uniref:hypothetical protein n=1 Tax=Vibrio TaxID=662 RepID=UPI0020750D67|nr:MULTISPECIES: hypothetical protein [Vibrio]USD33731.1 hypothetical protein J8Z27_06420 [Vibrio sp. SCSIO 43186]USD46802.1 hypothetical protein J4N38_06620 [Vibrio sp. SCSIO 43145]USD70855.1 hypothetical protein J4N41_06420 [Vibrio sp. SCSIO 43139]USD95768.1 hypothetical protein CTT30_06525 [Vibrio coralliilyticus]